MQATSAANHRTMCGLLPVADDQEREKSYTMRRVSSFPFNFIKTKRNVPGIQCKIYVEAEKGKK
jgi:hypothetical protein